VAVAHAEASVENKLLLFRIWKMGFPLLRKIFIPKTIAAAANQDNQSKQVFEAQRNRNSGRV